MVSFFVSGIASPVTAQAADQTVVGVVESSSKCRKATARVASAKKVYVKAKSSGNLRAFTSAYKKWRQAVHNQQVACSAPPPAKVVVPSSPSGHPNDQRPVGWVRPADGSGLPGSNAAGVTVQDSCPVTVSRYEFRTRQYTDDPNIVSWSLSLRVQNFSKDAHTVRVVVTAVDASGKPFFDKWAGDMNPLWNDKTKVEPYVDGSSTLVFTPFNANLDVAGARVVSITVTCE